MGCRLTLASCCMLTCFALTARGEGLVSSPAEAMELVFFTSNGKTGIVHPDGLERRVLDFAHLNQQSWQPMCLMPDKRRILLLSREFPKNPNASFYDKDGMRHAPTHVWMYDLFEQSLDEVALPAGMTVTGVLPESNRFLLTGQPDGDDRTKVFTCGVDGSEPRLVHDCGGFAYGFSLSRDGRYVAFHGCSSGYEVFTLELAGGTLRKLASDPDLLMFGTEFSPDGRWVLYQSCQYKDDPFHGRSDLRISRPDGSETRILTTGQRHWFATAFGPQDNPGFGSNAPRFSPDGKWITYARLLPDSRTAWVYRPDREDRDHFNCDFDLSAARGGTQLCLIDLNGGVKELTNDEPPMWNWRAAWSPNGKQLGFARAAAGQTASLWIIGADGTNLRKLSDGFDGKNADFPGWQRFERMPE